LSLYEDGLVSRKVEEQDNWPAKKMYALTEPGQKMLENWLKTVPELPQRKHAFLLQLGWADLLPAEELDHLLSLYEEEVTALALITHAQHDQPFYPSRTRREKMLWEAIHSNLDGYYQYEINWVQQLRRQLSVFSRQE
jgi:hypothetical protein